MKRLSGLLTIAALIGLLLIPGLLHGQAPRRLRIAIQPGIGYAHLIVMRELKMLEKQIPGLQVEWLRLTSGPVIRDAMLAGQVDIGSGGVGPFIIAWDRGVKWKIVSALNQMPLYLNTNRDGVRTIKDLTQSDKIAMPAVGSIQHVVLQMAAEKELGNPLALDQLIVAMSHPDGMFALISKREITGHLTSPPFQYLELQITGIRKVLDSYQVLGGPHTFNLVWAMEDFPRRNPEVYQAFLRAVDEATAYLIDHRDDAARILAESENTQPGFMRALLRNPELQYTTTPHRLMQFAGFLKKTNQIKQAPASWKEFAFENMHRLPGD
ncbi:MAG TPA: ABC transporter substrate-binding protein [bacterium]|nr:ABC transporter substrate-binding protein [bacterium]